MRSWMIEGRNRAASSECSALSSREREVMAWQRAGKSIEETATILGISPRTVEKHRQNLSKKLRSWESGSI
ncbi:LuxR C-terminal-related transcriptional regulator [Haloferula chungangensis]|uniref:LuxR C-terminal-related transcriptional regulator n=1 Tax=Haloferula chungangensis TaxID=1048331 RepID=A0ABW2L3T0_9BACT